MQRTPHGNGGCNRPHLANSARPFRQTLSREYGATCCPGLQEAPDAKAIALLNRLKSAYPDRFNDTHLRTLQRRVQQWRGIMSKELVYAAAGEPWRDSLQCRN